MQINRTGELKLSVSGDRVETAVFVRHRVELVGVGRPADDSAYEKELHAKVTTRARPSDNEVE